MQEIQKPQTFMSPAQKKEFRAVSRIDLFLNFLQFLYINIKDAYTPLSMEDVCKKHGVPSILYSIMRKHGQLKCIGNHQKSWRYTGPIPTEALAETLWEKTKLYQRQSLQQRKMKELPKNINGRQLVPISKKEIIINSNIDQIEIKPIIKVNKNRNPETVTKYLALLNYLYGMNNLQLNGLSKVLKSYNITNVVAVILKHDGYLKIDPKSKKLIWLTDIPSSEMVEILLKSVADYNKNHLQRYSNLTNVSVRSNSKKDSTIQNIIKSNENNINKEQRDVIKTTEHSSNKLIQHSKIDEQKIHLAELFTKLGKYETAIQLLS